MSQRSKSIDLHEHLDRFRKRLLDMTRRNRLLHYRETKRTSIRIVDELPDQIYLHLLEKGKAFYFDSDDDGLWADREDDVMDLAQRPSADSQPHRRHRDSRLQTRLEYEELQKSLNAIRIRATTAIQETGVNYLYMALGFLKWYESPDSNKPGLAPLILIPVKLDKKFDDSIGEHVLSLQPTGEDVQSNPALIESMNQDFGVVIPELDPDELPESYFNRVTSAVANRASRDDRWEVVRRANLGFFSFAKLLMYRDLDPSSWPDDEPIHQHPILRQMFTGEGSDHSTGSDGMRFKADYHIDQHPRGNDLAIVDDADSSQHSALLDIDAGNTLVIEGPPGTGKSQTITNAIAVAISEGKSVLFVSEKLAALEVVRNRLDRLGLGSLCLELHSEKATPRTVLDDLESRLNARFPKPKQIQQKKELVEAEKSRIGDYLDAVMQRLGPHEESLCDVFWRVVELRGRGLEALAGTKVDLNWGLTEFEERRRLLGSLSSFFAEIGQPSEHPWLGFYCPKLRGESGVKAVGQLLDRVIELGATTRETTERLLDNETRETAKDFRDVVHSEHLQRIDLDSLSRNTLPRNVLENKELRRLAIDADTRKVIKRFCIEVHEAREARKHLDRWIREEPKEARRHASKLIVLIGEEFSYCREQLTVGGIQQARELCRNSLRLLSEIEGYVDQLSQLGHKRPVDLHQMLSIVDKHELMTQSGNFDWPVLCANHFLSGTNDALAKAKAAGQSLAQRREEAEERIRVNEALERDDLKHLSRSLSIYQHRKLRILSSDYRSLWREIKPLLRPPVPKLGIVASIFLTLHDYQEYCRRFSEHRETVTHLGAAFTGVDTDWQHLDLVVAWATDARTLGLGFDEATRLKANYQEGSDLPDPVQIRTTISLLHSELNTEPLRSILGDLADRLHTVRLGKLRRDIEHIEKNTGDLTDNLAPFIIENDTSLDKLEKRARAVVSFVKTEKRLAKGEGTRQLLGDAYHGIDTDLDIVSGSLKWAERLADTRLPTPMIQWVTHRSLEERLEQLVAYLREIIPIDHKYAKAIEALNGHGGASKNWLSDGNSCSIEARCQHLRESLPLLRRWSDWCRTVAQSKQLAVHGFVEAAEQGLLDVGEIENVFDLTFYEQLSDDAIAKNHALQNFSRVDIEQARTRFKELDQEVIRLERLAVASRATKRNIPIGESSGRVKDLTELSLIEHEIPKQRRLCRVRQLMLRAQNAIRALKPCFMMSPLSVAQFLPAGKIHFDLVIFDEASQVKPEDALGAVARGKQVVVVGDPKQLPPTSFFDKLSEGEIDEDELTLADETESILEVAMKTTGNTRRLKWHYRSQHESLISFSNDRFYDGELVVFPSPVQGDATRAGVFLRHVPNATYQPKQGNRVEAEAIAAAIATHAVNYPEETLGVGAFNILQRDLIEECLDRIRKDDPVAGRALDKLREETHEGLFVKNLESLQGDERDVIFISYGWAPEIAGGEPFQRFGPMVSATGWRRLNVLITRARKRVEVFSSIGPEQIVGGPSKSRGVNAMKDYLEFAQTGRIPDRGVVTDREPDSPFEIAVGRVLTSMGLEYEYQVGVAGYFIDLAVRHPERPDEFVLGIECDGATYHSAKSARDRDRLRESVISGRGWELHRIWSADWFYNQEDEVKRLRERLVTVCGLSIGIED